MERTAINLFYQYDYQDPDSVYSRLSYLDNRGYAAGRDFSNAIEKYNRRLGCGQATLENIRRMTVEPFYAVVTGQQAGLLTGPLYTVLKAVTAVNLASRRQQELGRAVLPFFWIAGEDHDYQEIAWTTIINAKGKPARLVLPGNTRKGWSVGALPVEDKVYVFLDNLAAQLPDTPHKEGLLDTLYHTARQSDTLSDWFGRLMAKLFKDYGLILMDPMDPPLRRLLKPFLLQSIKEVSNIRNAIAKTTRRVAEAGLPVQLVFPADNTNLFYYDNHVRTALYQRDNRWYAKDGRMIFTDQDQLLQEASDQPEAFSPNVALRPIFQDGLLPTLAYVAGPGEMAYYAQLKEVYPLFEMEMPIIHPRNRAIVLKNNHRVIMDRCRLTVEDIRQNRLRDRLRETLMQGGYKEAGDLLRQLKSLCESRYSQLGEMSVLADRRDELVRNLNRITHQISYMDNRLYGYSKRDQKEIAQEFANIMDWTMPRGKPQERELNIFSLINERGTGIVDALISRLDPCPVSDEAAVLWV